MLVKTSALAVVAVIIATAGQLVLKAGMEKVGYVGSDRLGKPMTLITQMITEPLVVAGLALFGMSAFGWLIVLSRAPLSFAYPFAGLTYVFVTLADRVFLHTRVPALRWLGILLVLTGIVIVGRTAPADMDKQARVGVTEPSSG